MPDFHYEDSRLAQIYDYDSPWSEDRDFYLSLAKGDSLHILDIGCGTGLLSNAYARAGHKVTAVDPCAAMLDVGRQKECGSDIDWVLSTAQDFRSPDVFDLIVMTGNVFQVYLTQEDILNVFKTIKAHIKLGGMIVFETRNPEIGWKNIWNYKMDFDTPFGCVHETRTFESMEDGIMSFRLDYVFPKDQVTSNSKIKFWTRKEIENAFSKAGLELSVLWGDWRGANFKPDRSKYMIFCLKG